MFLSFKRYAVSVRGRLFGVESSRVGVKDAYGNEVPYLHRWILYAGIGTLRLHKFYRGDDARASHTHPWRFWTFPLRTYREGVFSKGVYQGTRIVKGWRVHYRPPDFEHIVSDAGRVEYTPFLRRGAWVHRPGPFWTLVVTGNRLEEEWGFYTAPGKFVNWRLYDAA